LQNCINKLLAILRANCFILNNLSIAYINWPFYMYYYSNIINILKIPYICLLDDQYFSQARRNKHSNTREKGRRKLTLASGKLVVDRCGRLSPSCGRRLSPRCACGNCVAPYYLVALSPRDVWRYFFSHHHQLYQCNTSEAHEGYFFSPKFCISSQYLTIKDSISNDR
jgi:hypothetical protein